MKQSKFPRGWDESQVRRVLAHYEEQSEEEAVAEGETATEDNSETVMEIPNDLVPAVRSSLQKDELVELNRPHAVDSRLLLSTDETKEYLPRRMRLPNWEKAIDAEQLYQSCVVSLS